MTVDIRQAEEMRQVAEIGPARVVTPRLRQASRPPAAIATPVAALRRRRRMVRLGKRLLPAAALLLLASVVLWPELANDIDHARLSYRRGVITPEGGQLSGVRYNGLDGDGQPYTITATTARQVAPERIDMNAPIGDLQLNSGSWLQVRSRQGVYMQIAGLLDLSGDMVLYRDDGTTLTTDSGTVDVKAGAATSAEMTHVEGPFGTLDAQGFIMTDSGQLIRFAGPGRMVLNASHPAAPAPTSSAPASSAPASNIPVPAP